MNKTISLIVILTVGIAVAGFFVAKKVFIPGRTRTDIILPPTLFKTQEQRAAVREEIGRRIKTLSNTASNVSDMSNSVNSLDENQDL